ncbi:MAG TPA: ABC transporter transmembrane domain-containing protein [Acidimicrobiia bacterium]|nr:ABC transporter transmembrane domain-containing protein [Acidimicrobiia bacterium]
MAERASLGTQARQIRRLYGFARPYRVRLILGTAAVVVAAGLGLIFPLVIGTLVDTAFIDPENADTSQLNLYAIGLLAIFAVQAVFNYARTYNLAVVGEGVVADLRRTVFDRVVRLPVPFFDERHTGDLTSRLTSDVVVVQSIVSDALGRTLSQAITLVGGVALAVVISPVLSLSILTFLPVIVLAAALFGRRLRLLSTEYHDQLASANALAEESISSVRVVKWFNAEDRLSADYDAEVVASYAVARRRARMRALFVPLVTFVGFATLALVLWIGGRLVAGGSLTPGELISFMLYTLTIAGALGSFTGLYGEIQEALGSSRRIFELLGADPELPETTIDAALLPAPSGSVRFSGVEFAYEGREATVLHDIDLDVQPGEVVALVGPSGAGKSTIVQLVPRFYDVDSGSVEVDGLDVRSYPVDVLRSRMAAVPQEVQLFSGTIAENLRIADPGASDDDLVTAAKAANAHRFIVEFPDGYESIVGERGVKLSGGQRQRIAIARALLADPRILILDEATSSLDAESEALVQEALERLMAGRTTIVIAHRLSTVMRADRLVAIDRGRIVEEGTHADLVASDGLYARLYARQLAR